MLNFLRVSGDLPIQFAFSSFVHHLLQLLQEGDNNEDCDEDEVPEITHWEAIGWLSVLTVWVSILSGYLVDAIQVMCI